MGEVPGIVERHAGAAIAALEALLQGGAPTATDHLAEAVQELIRMRDGLIRELRAGRDCGQWLRQANSILSSILGTEFPIDGLQWNRVCRTRDALRQLLSAPPGGAPQSG